MIYFTKKEEALKALEEFFEKPLTIYDVIAMDRSPKQTQALCAALLGDPYPKGVNMGFLNRAVNSLIKSPIPKDRARASIIVAQAEKTAEAKVRAARAEGAKILEEANEGYDVVVGRARRKGEEEAKLLVRSAKEQCRAYMANIDAAIRQLNARIKQAEAAGVETGLEEAPAMFEGSPTWASAE